MAKLPVQCNRTKQDLYNLYKYVQGTDVGDLSEIIAQVSANTGDINQLKTNKDLVASQISTLNGKVSNIETNYNKVTKKSSTTPVNVTTAATNLGSVSLKAGTYLCNLSLTSGAKTSTATATYVSIFLSSSSTGAHIDFNKLARAFTQSNAAASGATSFILELNQDTNLFVNASGQANGTINAYEYSFIKLF